SAAGTIIIATNDYGIENRASMQILPEAQVTIAKAGMIGLLNSPNGFLVNSGTIEIGFINSIFWGLSNEGIINNLANGKIRVGKFGQAGVLNGVVGTITNHGTLEIGHV